MKLKQKLIEIKSKLNTIEESLSYSEAHNLMDNFEKNLGSIIEKSSDYYILVKVEYKADLRDVLLGHTSPEKLKEKYEKYIENLEKFKKLYPNQKIEFDEAQLVMYGTSKKYPLKTFEDTMKSKKVGNVTSKL